jgi:hypothetical protein
MQFDDTLMGQLIQYVCTHEVGHTLGLQHNFRASSTIPVDSLRSKNYVAKNSHTPSIMDYARFNYVAQPEDSIDVKDLIPRIGVYDDWAIEWGYRWLPDFKTDEEEKSYLNKWVIKRLSQDKRLMFSDGQHQDLLRKVEDLGDDAVKASTYGIKNLQRVMANLKEWTKTPNGSYDELGRLQMAVIFQYSNYISHVVDDIGAVYWTPKVVEQPEPLYSFPNREKQKAAVQFLQKQLFATPAWIDNKELFPYIGHTGLVWIYKLQEFWIHNLVSPQLYITMFYHVSYLPARETYNFDELLTDMENSIWNELDNHKLIELHRRNLQKIYVYKLIKFMDQKVGDLGLNDACTIVENHIHKLYSKINKAIPGYKDEMSGTHLKDLRDRLKKELDFESGKNVERSGKSERAFNIQLLDTPMKGSLDFIGQPDHWSCWDGFNKFKSELMETDQIESK